MKLRISHLKALHELVQDRSCQLAVFAEGRHIVHVADLEYDLIERLFLFALADFFVIVFNAAVFAFLLGIVGGKCFVEQFVVGLPDGSIAIFNVEMAAGGIDIFCGIGASVMCNNTFTG